MSESRERTKDWRTLGADWHVTGGCCMDCYNGHGPCIEAGDCPCHHRGTPEHAVEEQEYEWSW